MGWVLKELLSSALNAQSDNVRSRDNPYQTQLGNILGRDSETVQCISQTGGGIDSICSAFTFPDTQSAIITMTNGRILGVASDFATQILIQALFYLTPSVDIKSWENVKQLSWRNIWPKKSWTNGRWAGGSKIPEETQQST